MAYTRLAHTIAAPTNALLTTAGPIATTGATLLVVAVAQGGVTVTLTDSKGNTWVPCTAFGPGVNPPVVQWYYCESPVTDAAHTAQITSSGGMYAPMFFAAYSGSGALPFDQENGSYNTASTIQPGSVTPSEDAELILVAFGLGSSGGAARLPVSVNGGFSIVDSLDGVFGASYGLVVVELIQTTATAANPTLTPTGSDGNSAAIATFKTGVVSTPPTSDFTTAVNQKTVTLTDASTAGTSPITSYDSDWGDSTTHGTTQNGTHTYSVGGAYTITRVVSDGTLSDSATADIVTTTRHVIQVIRNPGNFAASVNADVPDA